jgi:hypothetical protein
MAKRKASGSSKTATSRTRGAKQPARAGRKKTGLKQARTRDAKAGATARTKAGGRKKTAASASKKKKKTTAASSKRPTSSTQGRGTKAVGARRARKGGTRRAPTARGARPKATARRRPDLDETVPTPPSSLDMNRRGSAARTGRAELAEERADLASMTPSITGGDVDADVETAYFSGDEAPGGDNPTPDQDIVDNIGRALGVEYQDNEELRASDKVAARDRHRWELDPASAEDYKDRT